MKVSVIKTANGKLWAADDISQEYIAKLSNGERSKSINKKELAYMLPKSFRPLMKAKADSEESSKYKLSNKTIFGGDLKRVIITKSDDKTLADIPGVCGIVDGSVMGGYYGIEAGQSAVGDIFFYICGQRLRSNSFPCKIPPSMEKRQ